MKILMTGATGLIGQELGLELFKRGHQIFVVSRDRKKALIRLPFPCEVIEGDLGEKPLKHPILDTIEGVVHLMGESVAEKRWSSVQKSKIFDSRVLGTRNLVNSFLGKTPAVFVSASAVGIYGAAGDRELFESADPGPGFLADVCVGWEKEVDDISERGNTRVVKFRLPPVLARQGGALEKMLPAFQAGVGGRLGSGKQWMSWIHLQDVIQAFVKALEGNQFQGAYNLTAPDIKTNSDFSKVLCEVLNRRMGPPVPEIALKVLFGEMSQVILASQKVIPQRLLSMGFEFQYPNLKEALMEILKYQHQGEEIYEAKQYVPLEVEQAFAFFAEAGNLEKITPEDLKFQIAHMSTPKIQQGTLIDYNLKIQGIPVKWRTLIAKWDPPHLFVDQALKGPYKYWHHTHKFSKLGEGTLIEDEVRYVLPLGRLGWLVAFNKVGRDLKKIFDFRRKVVAESMDLR